MVILWWFSENTYESSNPAFLNYISKRCYPYDNLQAFFCKDMEITVTLTYKSITASIDKEPFSKIQLSLNARFPKTWKLMNILRHRAFSIQKLFQCLYSFYRKIEIKNIHCSQPCLHGGRCEDIVALHATKFLNVNRRTSSIFFSSVPAWKLQINKVGVESFRFITNSFLMTFQLGVRPIFIKEYRWKTVFFSWRSLKLNLL